MYYSIYNVWWDVHLCCFTWFRNGSMDWRQCTYLVYIYFINLWVTTCSIFHFLDFFFLMWFSCFLSFCNKWVIFVVKLFIEHEDSYLITSTRTVLIQQKCETSWNFFWLRTSTLSILVYLTVSTSYSPSLWN